MHVPRFNDVLLILTGMTRRKSFWHSFLPAKPIANGHIMNCVFFQNIIIMNYPLISEYIESIKNAEDNFNELTNLRPVYDEAGEIVMSSGNFAVVFKMKDECSGKLYAVKCFLKEQEGRNIAYQQITDELEYVSSNYLCSIKYFQKELFVDSTVSSDTEFPVLLMDWVEGVTLDKYVHQHISDKYALQLITYQFCRMAAWLMSQPFAHGDLKPDNILVTVDGALVLVDYDGMYVPAMQGQKARELGSPDYRHPLRTEDCFNEHIDDFPLALIGMSLKAIALDTSLLQNNAKSDSLLFSESDFQNIGECQMMKSLCTLLNDAEFSKLYALFLLAHSQQELSAVSFRLFLLNKVEKPMIEVFCTEVTEEDLEVNNQTNSTILRVVEIRKSNRFGETKDDVLNDIVTLYLSKDNGGILSKTFASTLYAVGAHLRLLSNTRVRNDDDTIDWDRTFEKVAEEVKGQTDDSLKGYDLPISELSDGLFTDGSYPEQFDEIIIKSTGNTMSVFHIAAPDKDTAVTLAKSNLRRRIVKGDFEVVEPEDGESK